MTDFTKPILERVLEFADDAGDLFTGNERQQEMTRLAKEEGYTYEKRWSFSQVDSTFKSLLLFRKKRWIRFRHVLTRQAPELGGSLHIFDIHLNADSGSSQLTVVLLRSSWLKLPLFRLRPRNTWKKVTTLFSSRVEEQVFSPLIARDFALDGDTPEQLEPYVTATLEKLLRDNPSLAMEGVDGYLMLYLGKKIRATKDIPQLVALSDQIARIFLFDLSNDLV
ncbi:MAG: hypothetical protein H6555_05575 [Lewinellaceae bacterium]|nr:hypothetical protein [Lewinellaceae bacterium]